MNQLLNLPCLSRNTASLLFLIFKPAINLQHSLIFSTSCSQKQPPCDSSNRHLISVFIPVRLSTAAVRKKILKTKREMENQRHGERQAVVLSKRKPHGERRKRGKTHKLKVRVSPSERLSETDRQANRYRLYHCACFPPICFVEAGGLI